MSKTIDAFVDCMEGNDLTQGVPARKFMERFLDREVDAGEMRVFFNAFHSNCPNFVVGQDDCPDCIAEHAQ